MGETVTVTFRGVFEEALGGPLEPPPPPPKFDDEAEAMAWVWA